MSSPSRHAGVKHCKRVDVEIVAGVVVLPKLHTAFGLLKNPIPEAMIKVPPRALAKDGAKLKSAAPDRYSKSKAPPTPGMSSDAM